MFDNYSIADLFANIYKKKVLNLVSLIDQLGVTQLHGTKVVF